MYHTYVPNPIKSKKMRGTGAAASCEMGVVELV